MNKLIAKTKEFIFAQQTSIFSSTLIISGMIIISRLAGFFRYRILNGFFTKEELDIYYAAFRLPDLIFEILITGALSTTFIPFFIKHQNESADHKNIISSIINLILLLLIIMIALLSLLLPKIIPLITPGFSINKIQQIILYSQIILICQLPFLVFGNFLTGISQAKKIFIIPALAPLIYNLAIIAATLLLTDDFHLLAPIIGVVVGAVLFFLVQLPILKHAQFGYSLSISYIGEAWKFFKTAIPRMFTIVMSQIDATIDLTLATLVSSGAYTIFYYAQHLQLLPVSIIGIAFGQAALPYLAELYQNKKITELKKIIEESLLNIFYLTIPIAAFFIFARTPIVRLFFGGQKFDWEATVLTAITLSYFAISLPLHAIYYFLTRCFFALFDTKTPFYISLISIIVNTTLSIGFILYLKLPVWAMAIAFSVSMTINVLLLFIILSNRINFNNTKNLMFETVKIVFATFNAAFISYGLLKLFDGLIFDTSRTINVFFLLVFCGCAYLFIYLFLTWLFGIREMYVLTKMTLKVREYQRKIWELYKGIE